MPFPFVLSTTSHLSFHPSLTSSTHPSLPSTATTRRALVRSALKEHKHLSSSSDKATRLPDLVPVLEDYLKYLVSIDLALSGKPVSGEEVDITLVHETEVEWRPTLSSGGSKITGTSTGTSTNNASTLAIPGRRGPRLWRGNNRVKSRDFDFELFFVHHTLALVHSLLARQCLLSLYASSMWVTTPTNEEDRAVLVQNATKRLRTAYSIHAYLVHRSNSSSDGPPSFPPEARDISVAVQIGLQYLAHAELNLLAVLKDDPYPAVVMQSQNKHDREWMYKSPSIPKVAAQVRRRLCVGAAEKAEAALANLRSSTSSISSSNSGASTATTTTAAAAAKVSQDLIDYCDNVRRTARAKACRFAALDADMGGETGKAIAWLRAGMSELDMEVVSVSENGKTKRAVVATTILPVAATVAGSLGTTGGPSTSSSSGGLKKLKASWKEKKEEKKIASGCWEGWGNGGADGGKAEESRILDYIHAKLTKENDTINVQLVPDWRPLLSTMPSGMHISVNDAVWKPTTLSEDELIAMRSPPDYDEDEIGVDDEDDEDDDDDDDEDDNDDGPSADNNERRKERSRSRRSAGAGVEGTSALAHRQSTYY